MKLKRLNTTRGAHRGQMTKLMKSGNEIIKSQPADTANAQVTGETTVDTSSLVKLRGILDSIYTKLEMLKLLDNDIIDLIPEEELADKIIESDDIIEKYCREIHELDHKIKKLSNLTASSSLNAGAEHTTSTKKKVNLPKLQLPKFDGCLIKWSSYHDAFCAAIDNDNSLEDIQKFQYLRSTLSGEATRTIDGLQLTNANYTVALSLLKERYGQPHKIISAYMKALWQLPDAMYNLDSVKEFYDNLETYIRGLKALGKCEDNYGDLLILIILEKLPSQLKTQISREHGDSAWSLKQLREAIYKEIQAFEADVENASASNSSISSTSAFHVASKKKVLQSHNAKPWVVICAFCKGDHFSLNCLKVADKQKRREICKRDKLCFNCLRNNHIVSDCFSKKKCKNCQNKHHTALCLSDTEVVKKEVKPTQPVVNESEVTQITLTPAGTLPTGPVLLKTACTKLWHVNKAVTMNILLDEGAQRSFISENAVRKLGVNLNECQTEQINLSSFGDENSHVRNVSLVNVQLELIDGKRKDMSTLVVPKISCPMKNFVHKTVQNYDYLKDLKLAHSIEKGVFEIDMLIGADYYWSIVEDKIIRGPGPTAVSSKLGFLLSGPTNIKPVSVMNTAVFKTIVSNKDVDDNIISKFWDLEIIGVFDETAQKVCDYENYRDTKIHWENGKYTANLPWKSDHDILPTNHDICYKRTRCMAKRLSPELRQIYDNIISDQLKRGFIELVVDDDNARGHYIPHHAVHKDSPTTPIRIVYDCSCKQGKNSSLNDCLDTGPSLINDMVEMLIRFRLHEVAIVSDIEKAFLNIQLSESDRNFTKFFWLSDPCDTESEFKVYRFKAVLFGSVSSPFILNAVIKSLIQLK